jgi:hypothetical protein
MRRRLMVICALFFSACAPMAWERPGASQNDLATDRFECLRQSQQRVSGGGQAPDQLITNSKLFKSCMTAKGWHSLR